ncbi:MAG: hypothetical protein ACRCWJ_14500 [Casimicrobium sp.]
MKYIKKFFLWAFGLIGALLLTVVALQVYYRLTPVELSDEAKALLEETKHMAQLTENGYRLLGLRAPKVLSPVDYARCIESIEIERARAMMSGALKGKEEWSAEKVAEVGKPFEARLDACRNGEPLLRTEPARQSATRISPGVNLATVPQRAITDDERLIEARFLEVMAGGARGNNPDSLATLPSFSDVLAIEQERVLEGWRRWNAAERDAATADMASRIARWAEFANGTLIESMIAAAAISRQIVALQSVIASEPSLENALARSTSNALAPAEKLPKHIGNAIAAEIQFGRVMLAQIERGEPHAVEHLGAFEPFVRFGFDRNDTLNHMASGYSRARLKVLADARAKASVEQGHEVPGCAAHFMMWCIVFERNPTGRVLSWIATPQYDRYAVRAHDVRTLAAATRLTIEARARGLQGEALAKFVASAPADMRDVVTGEAFAYDAASKKLTVKLQTKSTVLGETSYTLPL